MTTFYDELALRRAGRDPYWLATDGAIESGLHTRPNPAPPETSLTDYEIREAIIRADQDRAGKIAAELLRACRRLESVKDD